MAKKMKAGGPTGEDRAKFGKNMAKVMNQGTTKMAAGGGIKIRGTGAAERGIKARGPMA
jgi:hypothetical protein